MKISTASFVDLRQGAERIRVALRELNGVSEQFIDDINVILEKYQNDTVVNSMLFQLVSELFISFYCLINTSIKYEQKVNSNIVHQIVRCVAWPILRKEKVLKSMWKP